MLLSPNTDTKDPAGRFTANVLALAAQYERELIGVRNLRGDGATQAEGKPKGPRPTLPDELYRRVIASHSAGGPLAVLQLS